MLKDWRVRCVYSHWYPKLAGIEAITLYPFILFASAPNFVPDYLYKHELRHVAQVRRDGYLFYARYLLEVLRGMWRFRGWALAGRPSECFWRAYWWVGYEVEAREYEKLPLTAAERSELGIESETTRRQGEDSEAV